MKSIGITLNGADPIQQQLQDLDAQSRILAGLPDRYISVPLNNSQIKTTTIILDIEQ